MQREVRQQIMPMMNRSLRGARRLYPLLVMVLAGASLPVAEADASAREVTDLQAIMPTVDFEKAGLEKLTPAERAHLETWLNAYLTGEKQKAAEAAAEKAVEEKVAEIRETTERNFGFFGFLDRDERVPEEMKEPDFIESAIPGEFRGWSDGDRIESTADAISWCSRTPPCASRRVPSAGTSSAW
jgi:hypothetical protein